MLRELKNLSNTALTENGAVTPRTTESYCLDLFATIGALRNSGEQEIQDRFMRAFFEDPDLAMKTLFFARDIREGLGERRVFRDILKWLSGNRKESLVKNLELIPEYGRWDDVLTLLGTPARKEAESFLRKQFTTDLKALDGTGKVSLLGKWLPSVNASCRQTVTWARQLAGAFGMREREYRKALSALRTQIGIIENSLRRKDYTFNYAELPGKAMHKYRKAFIRNDRERYLSFLKKVAAGVAVLNAKTLMPYDIVNAAYRNPLSQEERLAMDTSWNALPDYTDGENALVVADGSGSMYWQHNPLPAAVAQSLAIYFAERSKGAFRGHFITFSRTPRLIEIRGRDIADKVQFVSSFNECANTNLAAVFDLILAAALRKRARQEDLPATLYIISDMEFDAAASNSSGSNLVTAEMKFAEHGYRLPRVVFWNVNSRNEQQPVTRNEQGVVLVSGCSAQLFSRVAGGEDVTPYAFMTETLGSSRYAAITA
ncbi:DUF2828 family protein [Succinimonas amylolytica]|uniref:DUF2828 family protein n=1 Tax=Succinimonas amylolytica TaxID=83769 RepID=UPI00037FF7AD|nr:DUF2828 family protein [Succinimonas amylolytica]